jgi:endogenous inhibitor of DNA gyrase (YacG/DUF329 family)
MANFKVDTRPGWIVKCPHCNEAIKYTQLTIWDAPSPFFYCNKCNNVLNRRSDEQRVLPKNNMSDEEYIAKTMTIWESILNTAPPCSCGGRFELWSNVKCPHCQYEFPYNEGVKNYAMRILERKIVIIDGTVLLGDTSDDSWIFRVRLDK